MPWHEILIALGGNATLLIVLAFLARSLIRTLLAKDINKFEVELKTKADAQIVRLENSLAQDAKLFEMQLKADADSQIEQLKNSLQMAALEHQVRFSKLHERRAKLIAELYAHLVDAERVGLGYVAQGGHVDADKPKQEEEYSKTLDQQLRLFFFVEKHHIYLPQHICALLKTFLDTMRKSVIGVHVYGSIHYPTPQTLEQRNQIIIKAIETFEGDIPAVRKALEDEFRKILGVENSGPPESQT